MPTYLPLSPLRLGPARGWSTQRPCRNLASFSTFSKNIDKKFVDRVIVQARGGNGGHGCASVRKGRTGKVAADGGHGGSGGDVIVQASRNVKSLAGLPRMLVSKHGGHGMSKKQHGKRGVDGVYLVPLGTQVRRLLERERLRAVVPEEGFRERENSKHSTDGESCGNTSKGGRSGECIDGMETSMLHLPMMIDLALEPLEDSEADGPNSGTETRYEFIGDLVQDGDRVIVAKGGAGGRGNMGLRRFGQDHQSDHELGEFVRVELEMKMISDLSLVGFPNVGKSSLLRKLSSAMPQVGSYAFTTTTPQLGSVSVGGSWDRFVVADVPGLIQGAHANRGVGHTFLRHVERAATIAYVLDARGAYAMDGSKTRLPPEEQLVQLRDELGQFSSALLDKRWMVVLNKMDLVRRRRAFVDEFRTWLAERYGEVPVVCVSALVPETRETDTISTLVHAMNNLKRH